jgi:hypothetical protein
MQCPAGLCEYGSGRQGFVFRVTSRTDYTTRSRNLQSATRFTPLRLTATSSTGVTKRNRIYGMLVVYWRGVTVPSLASSIYIYIYIHSVATLSLGAVSTSVLEVILYLPYNLIITMKFLARQRLLSTRFSNKELQYSESF